ncbi:MAG: MBL fold metallo-hydrolase [Clostridia bacterium]|nr:MBL fold metallo-hydrolase [Clostridia bacterium]
MKITYFGHSCFTLETEGYTIALDPYDEHVPGYKPLDIKACAVYCSHGHSDHCAIDKVQLMPGGENDPIDIVEMETYHDDCEGEKRGMNWMRIFEAEGLRVAHLGDLGCELEPEEIEELSGVDALLIPVGGYYTIGPDQAKAIVDQVKPRIVIPMHFRSEDKGFDVLADVKDFLVLCDNVRTEGDSIVLDKATPAGTVLLTSKN